MANEHVISQAVTEVLRRGHGCEAVRAARGEFFFHQAVLLELLAETGGPGAERARQEAEQCRQQGRAILGLVA